MTITEKILAAHADKTEVTPGEFIEAKVDLALGNDITAPIAIDAFEKLGPKEVFDRKRLVLVPDHYAPNKDIPSAEQCNILRKFARKQQLEYYFEVGRMGVEHALLPEQGLTLPGDLIIGADSHTCTYGALGAFSTGVGSTDLAAVMYSGHLWFKVPESLKFNCHGSLPKYSTGKDIILYIIGQIGVEGARYMAMEFAGEAISQLPIDDRLSICNMAIEAGGKNGIIAPDEKTEEYVAGQAKRPYKIYKSDPDAEYLKVFDYDMSTLKPMVACPHLPSNVKPADQLGDIAIDQVVIGSCTNGSITDLRLAAQVIKGRKVHPRLRLIVIPATQAIYKQALREGLLETFLDAEASISTPTCGPCLGGHMGILAEGERCLATTNRNFVGRMGHLKSEVYLCNPAVAAASAVAGHIVDPGGL